jgi:hypothetical protein
MDGTYDAPVTPQNWAIRSSLIFDFEALDCLAKGRLESGVGQADEMRDSPPL